MDVFYRSNAIEVHIGSRSFLKALFENVTKNSNKKLIIFATSVRPNRKHLGLNASKN